VCQLRAPASSRHNRAVTDPTADPMPELPAPDFSVKPTLTRERVLLRPFTLDADAPALRAMLQDAEAMRLTGGSHGPGDLPAWDAAAQARFREWYETRNLEQGRLDLAVVDRASARCVGEVVLNDWSPANRSCGFRTVLGPDGRGRGLGTEAVRMIVGYGFEQLGLHRISLEVYAFNPRARRAYEKAGFRPEGVLRESLRYGDQWIDATVMSILAPEWRTPRPANVGRRAGRSGVREPLRSRNTRAAASADNL